MANNPISPDDLRASIEAYNSYQNAQSPLDISHSHSINTIPSITRDYYFTDNFVGGERINGRMSSVRRFFCLFVTFDFLFTGLMWIICVMLNGEYLIKALTEQILHYDIKTSLFDIVLVAFLRFIVLILFYALIYINHWIVISLSTTLTCAFLTAKVFLYDWPHSTQPVFEVLLVLTSFVLSWGEAWFLDFRVLPQESYASRYIITNAEPERTPLIRQYIQGLPSSNYAESNSNFYSPIPSPNGSMHRFDAGENRPYPPYRFTKTEEDEYRKIASKSLEDAWRLYEKREWKLEKQKGSDMVYSRTEPKMGTIFKLECEVNGSPRFILEELFYRVDDLTKWNDSIKESCKIQSFDEYTDICYQISKPGAGGLVSSRDFVNLRHWTIVDGAYVLSCVNCDHPSVPANHKYVRAENRVALWVLRKSPINDNICIFHWILLTNLKMNVFKSVLEKEMINAMFKYVDNLRRHLINSSNLKHD